MAQFMCGLLLAVIGGAMLIHNNVLVQRSSDFYGSIPKSEFDRRLAFDRFLCSFVGAFAAAVGLGVLAGS